MVRRIRELYNQRSRLPRLNPNRISWHHQFFTPHNVREEPEQTGHILSRFIDAVKSYLVERASSDRACCASAGNQQAPSPFFQARPPSSSGGGLVDPRMRASNEGLRRPRVARAQKIIRLHPPSFLRVPPRIPCRFKSPRIKRASLPSSEPLNFPQLSPASSPFQRRHSGCSSNYPTGRADRGWERR